jgi:hypothetical protein
MDIGYWILGIGEWRMEDGEWRMEDGEWRMEDGGWRLVGGSWCLLGIGGHARQNSTYVLFSLYHKTIDHVTSILHNQVKFGKF